MNTSTKHKSINRLNNRISSLYFAAGAVSLHPILARAHPGHSLGESSLSHVVTSPYHVLVLLVVGAALVVGGTVIQRRLPRRLLQGCGMLALVAGAVCWGMGA